MAKFSDERIELIDRLIDIYDERSFLLCIDAMCETEDDVKRMLAFMDNHPEATSSDIIDEGLIIHYENELKKSKR